MSDQPGAAQRLPSTRQAGEGHGRGGTARRISRLSPQGFGAHVAERPTDTRLRWREGRPWDALGGGLGIKATEPPPPQTALEVACARSVPYSFPCSSRSFPNDHPSAFERGIGAAQRRELHAGSTLAADLAVPRCYPFSVGIPVGSSGGSRVGSFEVPPLLAPFALVGAQIRTARRVATYICVCMYISDIRSGPGAQGRMYSTGASGHRYSSTRYRRGVLAEAASARRRFVYSVLRGDICTRGLRWWCA